MSFDEKHIPSPFESSLNHLLSDDDKKAKIREILQRKI